MSIIFKKYKRANIATMMQCPCGSNHSYSVCCEVLHQSKASAKNAMRRHNTKQPKGAESKAKMLPAIQAGAMMANQAVIIDIRNIFRKRNKAVVA